MPLATRRLPVLSHLALVVLEGTQGEPKLREHVAPQVCRSAKPLVVGRPLEGPKPLSNVVELSVEWCTPRGGGLHAREYGSDFVSHRSQRALRRFGDRPLSGEQEGSELAGPVRPIGH